jgi:hypothetical protein
VYREVRHFLTARHDVPHNPGLQMYDDAMTAIHENLLKRSMKENLLYTSELIPERNPNGEM